MADLELGRIDEHRLGEYIAGQRWYGSKSREIAHASVVEEVPLQETSPRCSLVLAALRGWYSYSGRPLDATLGVLQQFVRGGSDGWEFALDTLAADPDAFLATLPRLGEVTGAMHSTLASDASDPSFAPEDSSVESL